jgi:hypothetical protein
VNKTYNIAAFGLPENLLAAVRKLAAGALPLTYSRHAMSEALNDRYGVLPYSCFPRAFIPGAGWTVVEVEANAKGALVKFVVRRPVDARRSLVLVVLADGTVKTLWTNLNSDQHATLDSSHFSKP